MDIPQVFVLVLVLALLGTLAFAGLQLCRRKFLYWTAKEE